jgi:hypothetical protein
VGPYPPRFGILIKMDTAEYTRGEAG